MAQTRLSVPIVLGYYDLMSLMASEPSQFKVLHAGCGFGKKVLPFS
jgi:hypothetical protein